MPPSKLKNIPQIYAVATRRTPSGLIATDDHSELRILGGRPVVGLNQETPLLLLIKRPRLVRAASVLPSAEDFMEYQLLTTRCTTGLELVEMSQQKMST